jgi:hypothetical protein
MEKNISNNFFIWCCCLLVGYFPYLAMAQGDSSAKIERQPMIYLQYHVRNNQVPFLYVQTKIKEGKKFLSVGKIPVSIYLNKDLEKDALVGQVVTNEKGEGSLVIPPALAGKWGQSPSHTFYAHTDSSADFGSASQEFTAVLSQLKLDTAGKTVTASLMKKDGENWVPMAGVDVRLTVKRHGGYLNIGDDDSYTTDSTGKVEAEFLKEKLPGDQSGKLELVALVDDNDEIGFVQSSMVVPWGVVHKYESDFGKRTLWSTPRKAPIWLLLMAYGCIISVWLVIIYLITRIVQIKKLGKQAAN